MGSEGFLILNIKHIVFARYPPRSETSQDGGLVDLECYLFEAHKLPASIPMVECDLSFKELLSRRLRNHRMCCICRCLYRHVEVQAVLCCILS
jgi:hypothetical protein